jgi:Domain of unknown function (DUF397)
VESAAPSTAVWIRSSRCHPGNNCVELAACDGTVLVRDSKYVDVRPLRFNYAAWQTFVRDYQSDCR